MTEYIIKNGCVVDPTQNINAQKMDICIKDGKFVDKVSNAAKVIDASGKLVMAAGVDIHSHVAGPKVDMGRLFRPEDTLSDAWQEHQNGDGFLCSEYHKDRI